MVQTGALRSRLHASAVAVVGVLLGVLVGVSQPGGAAVLSGFRGTTVTGSLSAADPAPDVAAAPTRHDLVAEAGAHLTAGTRPRDVTAAAAPDTATTGGTSTGLANSSRTPAPWFTASVVPASQVVLVGSGSHRALPVRAPPAARLA